MTILELFNLINFRDGCLPSSSISKLTPSHVYLRVLIILGILFSFTIIVGCGNIGVSSSSEPSTDTISRTNGDEDYSTNELVEPRDDTSGLPGNNIPVIPEQRDPNTPPQESASHQYCRSESAAYNKQFMAQTLIDWNGKSWGNSSAIPLGDWKELQFLGDISSKTLQIRKDETSEEVWRSLVENNYASNTQTSSTIDARNFASSGSYFLERDIYMPRMSCENEHSISIPKFSPISDFNAGIHFSGEFDGRNNSIRNLSIELSNTKIVGFFSSVERRRQNSAIRNLSFINANVKGGENTGGAVGVLHAGSIENISMGGSITGTLKVGGIVSEITGGTVRRVTNNASISATRGRVGGIVGVGSGTLEELTNNGPVATPEGQAGGLIGYMAAGVLRGGTNTGSVSSRTSAGGIAGHVASSSRISNATNTASVSTREGLSGGVVGHLVGAVVESSRNSGLISGEGSFIGGIIGYMGHLTQRQEPGSLGTLKDSSNTGSVSSDTGNSIGGAVGYLVNGNVSSVSVGTRNAPVTIRGKDHVGGIVGKNVNNTVGDTSTVITYHVTVIRTNGDNHTFGLISGDRPRNYRIYRGVILNQGPTPTYTSQYIYDIGSSIVQDANGSPLSGGKPLFGGW